MNALLCMIFIVNCVSAVPKPYTVVQRDPSKLSLYQVESLIVDCQRRDLVIPILEQQPQGSTKDPADMDEDERKYVSAVRTKLWQYRTYCQ